MATKWLRSVYIGIGYAYKLFCSSGIFTVQGHASAVYAVIVCLSVCHKLVFY